MHFAAACTCMRWFSARQAAGFSTSASKALIGFIGLGNMGQPMAANLIKAGFRLAVCDRVPEAVDRLRAQGAIAYSTPQEISELPAISGIVTMLPSTDAVKQVYEGPSGLLAARNGLRARVLIDSSTISPGYAEELAHAVAEAPPHEEAAAAGGCGFVDAPVSGGVPGAQAASLTFMCGGREADLQLAQPLLQAMGKRVVACGPVGAGQAAKLCNNLVLAIQMAAVSEGLALGQALGLDPRTLSAVFNTSSARCWSSEVYNPCPGVMLQVPAARAYRPGFSVQLMLKDVGLALQAAQGKAQPVPLGQVAQALYQQVQTAAGSEHLDFSAVFKYVYGGQPVPQ